jgi:hypothetical protein
VNVARFRHLMGQSVSLAPFTGRDGYGEPLYGTAVTHRARVVGKIRNVRSFTGQEVVSSQTVYLMAAAAVNPLDKLTLSTGFVNSTEADRTTPAIVATGRYPGSDGRAAYTAVFLA